MGAEAAAAHLLRGCVDAGCGLRAPPAPWPAAAPGPRSVALKSPRSPPSTPTPTPSPAARAAGIAVSLFALAASLGLGAAAIPLTVVGLCLFMGSYAFGIGPLNMVVVSEVFPFRLRAVAMSLAIFLNRLVSGTVASTFLSLTEAISMRGTFLLFGGIATLSWLFVLYMVPETKGKSLEEMETFFEQLEDERRLRAREKSPLVQAEDKPS